MLPAELLSVVRWRDSIRPRYSKLDGRDTSAAEAVVRAYGDGVGLKRGEVRERVAELEGAYGDFKLIRGLAALLERRCVFSSRSPLNPVEARHALFAEASSRGFPTTEAERRLRLETVAARLGVSPEQLEASMYADLESEMILESVPTVEPVELLKEYNLALTQTLLFQAAEMTFTASQNWQRIFRAIKYHGLMYVASRSGDQFTVRLDGPTSLFKLTRRYGLALARVLPEIFAGKPWRMEARILRGNRLLNFALDSGKHGWLFPEVRVQEAYDSSVEAEFASEFRALGTDWVLRREAEPLEAGSSIMIPDFAFQLGKTRVLMEVVGFWTKEYLRRKLEKLSAVKDTPFIVAVDEELACGKLVSLKASNPNLHIMYYVGRIPVRKVLELLEPYAEAEVRAQAAGLRLEVEKPVLTLAELAEGQGVTVEAVRRAAEKLETHVIVGEALVEKKLVEEIRRTLEEVVDPEAPLQTVLKALEPYSLPDPVAAVTYCGFEVRWRDLLNATVRRRTGIQRGGG